MWGFFCEKKDDYKLSLGGKWSRPNEAICIFQQSIMMKLRKSSYCLILINPKRARSQNSNPGFISQITYFYLYLQKF